MPKDTYFKKIRKLCMWKTISKRNRTVVSSKRCGRKNMEKSIFRFALPRVTSKILLVNVT